MSFNLTWLYSGHKDSTEGLLTPMAAEKPQSSCFSIGTYMGQLVLPETAISAYVYVSIGIDQITVLLMINSISDVCNSTK